MEINKNRIFINCLLLLAVFLVSCNKPHFKKNKDEVKISLNKSKTGGIKNLKLKVVSKNIIQVVASATDNFSTRESLVVIDQKEKYTDFHVKQKADIVTISTSNVSAKVNVNDATINFFDKDNNPILKEKKQKVYHVTTPLDDYYNIEQQFSLTETESLHGLGQNNNGIMNYRGHKELLIQTNHNAVSPFILSTNGYAILWDNYSETQFDNETDRNTMVIRSEVADEINYYFIHGKNNDDIVAGYRKLTGHAPLYGKWAYGYWQSKERYESQEQILAAAKGYRDRKIPIDNIVQDWEYWGENGWNAMVFDKKHFPNPDKMIQEIHDLNYHYMITIWPGSDKKTDIYKELKAAGHEYDDILADGGFICDMHSDEAGDIFWSHMKKNLFDKGVDAWWLDGTEPAVSNEFYPYCVKHELINNGIKNDLGTYRRYLNTFSLKESGHIYRNQRNVTDQKRVFMMSRSGFAGQQRNAAATWSGDINSTWEVLQNQVPAGLNFTMSGTPYWTSDIGGFFAEEFCPDGCSEDVIDEGYKELYVRWFQYGAFCPLFRSHGTFYPREVWQFGEPGSWPYESLLRAVNLRYRLMPYIYSNAWRITNEGYTLMRGLPFVFPNDEKTHAVTDQFMFGDAFLVNPMLESVFGKKIKPEPIPTENLINAENQSGLLTITEVKNQDIEEGGFKVITDIDPAPGGEWKEWEGCFAMGSKRITGQILTKEAGVYNLYLNKFSGDVILSPFNEKWHVEEVETGKKIPIDNLNFKANTKYKIVIEYSAEGEFNELAWITPNQRTNAPDNEPFRNVYLPKDNTWFNFWTGETVEGGQEITVDGQIDKIPLFVKAGSIVPMGPFIQYSDEKPADPIDLRIYTGADGEFELYEDENDTYNYEKGIYSTIKFEWNDSKQKLTIEKREGEFPGMLLERTFRITWVAPNHGIGVGINEQPDVVVTYTGEKIDIIKE